MVNSTKPAQGHRHADRVPSGDAVPPRARGGQGPGLPDEVTGHTLGLGSVQGILRPLATRRNLNRSSLLPRARSLCLRAAKHTRRQLFGRPGREAMPSGAAWLQFKGEGGGPTEASAPSVVPACGVVGTVYSTGESASYLRAAPLYVPQDWDAGCGKWVGVRRRGRERGVRAAGQGQRDGEQGARAGRA